MISHWLAFSLSYILEEMSEPKYPSFEIRMELTNSQIKYQPDVGIESEHNLLTYVRGMTNYVLSIIYSIPHILRSESPDEVSVVLQSVRILPGKRIRWMNK